ncbi:MAG: DUF3226 domain-containing protein [Chloroflexota bacterium]
MAIFNSRLLVKGKNDQHVIWALCKHYQLPEAFSVGTPPDGEGIEALLETLPILLRARGLQVLGVVADADQDLLSRWQALSGHFKINGYKNLPKRPPASGWISSQPRLPRVGIWLMPNNQLPGVLEDFARFLIPPEDALRPKAEAVLQEIEDAGLNRYKTIHHPKAFIYTWLAWQATPGLPMGTAITARALQADSPTAEAFVAWLRRLFEVSPS